MLLLLALFLAAACGSDEPPEPTARPISQAAAVQVFFREAYKVGWFAEGDPVETTVEAMLWEDAAARAQELGLSLYPTIPGTPPYPDGLPGWILTAAGDFHATAGTDATPDAAAARRPATAVAFVDRYGAITYSMRFTDIPATPNP